MAIAYCDGSEGRILEILQAAGDLSSTSLSAHELYSDWATRYHLCPERSNLLRHLDFTGLDVLELGAGMGATSRYVAENARSYFAVEGTESRTQALKSRLRDLDNWEAVVGNVQDFQTDRRFDVVLLIGVLEYAELYIKTGDDSSPFTWLLRHAASFLKPGGRLVIAIENRNGVKYWAGAPEDHTGRMFDGICGYAPTPTPRTFSRKVLLEHCAAAGLDSVDEYYPWPDYKTPVSVVSRALVDRYPFLVADIAADATAHEALQMKCYFPWTLALRGVARSGLLPEMANSFLLVAGSGETTEIRNRLRSFAEERGECAWHYSILRHKPIRTAFCMEGDAPPTIKKRPFSDIWPSSNRRYDFKTVNWVYPGDVPAMLGTTVLMALRQHAFMDDRTGFLAEFANFLQWAMAGWSQSPDLMKPEAFDLTPSNAVQEGDSYRPFDLEWQSPEPTPKSWFILRCLLVVRDALALFPTPPFENFTALYKDLCAGCGVSPDLKFDIEREAATQADIHRNMDADLAQRTISNIMSAPWLPAPFPHDPNAEFQRRTASGRSLPGLKRVFELIRSPRRFANALARRARRLAKSRTA